MKIATVFGIPVRLHWSFLGLVGTYLAFRVWTSGLVAGAYALVLAVALFTTVVLHELGHATAARAYGIRTAHITLYPFGGVAAITRPPRSPSEELVIALAGSAVNFALLFASGMLWLFFGGQALLTLAAINLVMGVFNLIPAFPMDGGRVLRALLTRPLGHYRASLVSIRIGQGFAWVFIALALVARAPGLALIGGFLLLVLRLERRRLASRPHIGRPDLVARARRTRPFTHPTPPFTRPVG